MAEQQGIKIMAKNRSAYHDYFVEETYEAGIELFGTEVKSIRLGTLNLKDAWCGVKDGELFLQERIKDLFKTSNGKYVAPQMVEGLLLVDKFVDQVVVIADQRKFVSALIVPEFGTLEDWANKNGVVYSSREELCENTTVREMMNERIMTLQQQLAPYEQIKRFKLISRHFSMENGELTNTLKLRRRVIYKNYAEDIDKMYEE